MILYGKKFSSHIILVRTETVETNTGYEVHLFLLACRLDDDNRMQMEQQDPVHPVVTWHHRN